LLDAENHIIGQRDSEPGGGARLTSTWRPGETIGDNYGIVVRPGTPSGAYVLELGLYRVEDGQRLVVTEGADVGTDRVVLPPIRVRPAETPLPLDAFGIQHPMREEMDALSLVGYDLYRLGYEHEPEQTLRRGDVLHLNLYWQVRQPLPDLGLSLRLVDRSGHIRLQRSSSLGGTAAPSSTWLVGEVIRDQHDIQLGQELPTGDFTLEAQLNDGKAGRVFRLGAVRIE